MGRRLTVGTARAGAHVDDHADAHAHAHGDAHVGVWVLDPAHDGARPCALRFDARGLVFESSGEGTPEALLRVPWWAIQGLAADNVVRGAGGQLVQALDVLTDAGTIHLALPAADVVVAVSLLSRHAARWRRRRLPPFRWMARRASRALPGWRALVLRCAQPARALRHRPAVALAVSLAAALTLATGTVAVAAGQRGPAPRSRAATAASDGPSIAISGMSRLVAAAHVRDGSAARLPAAAAPPPPAPPSISTSPALSPHEVFGFVPYWMLGEETTFDVAGYTTLAYFAVGVDGDGTLDESGTGWDGYESQAFADLVARAHAAGVRVVLTVNCFSLPVLEQLTSAPGTGATLAASVLAAIAAKNLDGVNIDFEGGGPLQRAGLTALVAEVSTAVHAANPRFQVTVDTDGDAAADPGTFYDVRALASVADGLFVMAYGLNYSATPGSASPITSDELSDVTEAAQYAAAVPPSKVIFGTSFFGYSWPTTNGTQAANATATGTPVTYAQVLASGHPIYWDDVTDTAWTSYETNGQWHEDYVEDPASVYLVASLAQREGFGGVGVWALGMDGDDAQMTAALDGKAPVEHAALAGPAWTPPSKASRLRARVSSRVGESRSPAGGRVAPGAGATTTTPPPPAEPVGPSTSTPPTGTTSTTSATTTSTTGGTSTTTTTTTLPGSASTTATTDPALPSTTQPSTTTTTAGASP